MVFFWAPAAFYAWAAQPLTTHEPSVARLPHRHATVPPETTFSNRPFSYMFAPSATVTTVFMTLDSVLEYGSKLTP